MEKPSRSAPGRTNRRRLALRCGDGRATRRSGFGAEWEELGLQSSSIGSLPAHRKSSVTGVRRCDRAPSSCDCCPPAGKRGTTTYQPRIREPIRVAGSTYASRRECSASAGLTRLCACSPSPWLGRGSDGGLARMTERRAVVVAPRCSRETSPVSTRPSRQEDPGSASHPCGLNSAPSALRSTRLRSAAAPLRSTIGARHRVGCDGAGCRTSAATTLECSRRCCPPPVCRPGSGRARRGRPRDSSTAPVPAPPLAERTDRRRRQPPMNACPTALNEDDAASRWRQAGPAPATGATRRRRRGCFT